MGLEPLFRLAASTTVNQLLRRLDFAERMADDRPISVLELLYPLMQAYDSVMLEADVELGGTDQLFNLMLGREVQQAYGARPQVAMTLPILPGTDGVRRMSKSTGNYIGVNESPEEQFGKIMSVPDAHMPAFYELLFPAEPAPAGHPNAAKRRLGRLVAERFHGQGAGHEAEAHFDRLFKDRRAPDDVPVVELPQGPVHLPALLVDSLGVGSRSEARRMVQQGGVNADGDPVRDLDIDASALDGRVVRAGKKRFARIRVSS
jgi:tyrosyl-tRNA synthetase